MIFDDDEKEKNQTGDESSITWDELLSNDDLDLASLAKDSPSLSDQEIKELGLEGDALEMDGVETNSVEDDTLSDAMLFSDNTDVNEADNQSIGELIEEDEDDEDDDEGFSSSGGFIPSSIGISSDQRSKTPLILASIGAFVFLAVGLFAFAYFKGMTPFSKADSDALLKESELGLVQKDELKDGLNNPAGPSLANDADKTKINVVEEDAKLDEKKVVVTIGEVGRLDPFVPYGGLNANNPDNLPSPDLMYPPEEMGDVPQARELLKTTVSGIMYDRYKPSAIININGSDFFVQRGDKIKTYVILDILRDTVIVRNGSNVYKAGVGELIEDGTVNQTDVYNLGKKFGGRRPSGYISSNEIQVNVKR